MSYVLYKSDRPLGEIPGTKMTTPTPQIRPYGTYPLTYTLLCAADTTFFIETPPPPSKSYQALT